MKTFLTARWENLVMANYEVPAEVLQPYLPNGIELDFFEGKAFVSLVGFMFKNTKLFKIPIPYFGTFEEVNLRFYVKRIHNNEIKRGVVFINETVPYKPVAWLANKLYQENYVAIPTKSKIEMFAETKELNYSWKIKNRWNQIQVKAYIEAKPMMRNSIEEFIFEHYYGYTKYNSQSQEYKVNHPSWQTNPIFDYTIDCDFSLMYGKEFEFLNTSTPHSVLLAEGSAVSIDWKRKTF